MKPPFPPFSWKRLLVTRKDGIRQHYWFKIYEIEEISIPEFFRATVAVNNVPIENQMYNFSLSRIAEIIDMDDLKDDLIFYMETEIGYSENEWWFTPVFGIEYPVAIEAEEPEDFEQHVVGKET